MMFNFHVIISPRTKDYMQVGAYVSLYALFSMFFVLRVVVKVMRELASIRPGPWFSRYFILLSISKILPNIIVYVMTINVII